jgi:hypothetical protein
MTMAKNNKYIDSRIESIWRFIRGDMKVQDFEQWVYSENNLEKMLGKTLYLETISVNYSDEDALRKIKELLSEYARQTSPLQCKCFQLSDMTVVATGEESKAVFQYMEEVTKRGEPFWWLSLEHCCECNQWWLVASEERHNDVYCLRRLDSQAADEILNKNSWPDCFDRYETLLRLGQHTGISVRFVDPMDSSLAWTISDLAKERPGIAISEIAKLLNLDMDVAKHLARKAVKNEGININLEDS